MSRHSAAEKGAPHDCATCPTCIHDGNECCGCYDGSCCLNRTWRYGTWSGGKATVVAHGVEFTPTHVVWRDREGAVVLAERPEQVNELAQVGTLGSATRGVRPATRPISPGQPEQVTE